MYVIIFLATLITLLVIILSTVVHLVSILMEESDDASQGLDWHDFSTTPVVSPNDNLLNPNEEPAQQQPAAKQSQTCGSCLKQLDAAHRHHPDENLASAIEVPSMSLMSPMLTADSAVPVKPMSPRDVISAPPEDVQSAELNSRLIKESESQRTDVDSPMPATPAQQMPATLGQSRESADSLDTLAPGEPSTASEPRSGASSWAHKPPDVQKSMISSQLGQPASKQIFDDFDPRELPLGGTALHWCRTRKTLDKLLKLGLPTDIVNKRRETAVHVAVRRHKLQVLIGLLINEAPVESRNENGETPLLVACKLNDIFATQLLLVFDANYEATDRWGHSARHYTAAICARHMSQQQLPSAAHLILAMLNEIGAKRCRAPRPSAERRDGAGADELAGRAQSPVSANGIARRSAANTPSAGAGRRAGEPPACSDGCAHAGTYEGNSYNRWPNFKRESAYKRHMFADLIETKLRNPDYPKDERGGAEGHEFDAPPLPKTARSRLLCIDGGGMRGVIVCQIMIEMERFLRRPMISYFDWVGGTSVGAFLACALCRGVPIRDMRRVCFDVKDEVFSGNRPYNSKFLERVLKRTYGSGTRMSQVRGVKLAVTTVLADREPCQLRLFRNYPSPGDMLEAHGYSQDKFNNMSGHSVMSGATCNSASSAPADQAAASSWGGGKTSQHQVARRPSNSRGGLGVSAPIEQTGSPRGSPSDRTLGGALADSANSQRHQVSSSSRNRVAATGNEPRESARQIQCDLRRRESSGCGTSKSQQPAQRKRVDERTDAADTALKCCCRDSICARSDASDEPIGRSAPTPATSDGTSAARVAARPATTEATNLSNTNKDAHPESMLDENDPDPVIWQAVRASAAAPFFFRPYGPYLDGGIISNNPTLDMLSEFENYQRVRQFLRRHARHRQARVPLGEPENDADSYIEEPPSRMDLVVSLGTGRGRVISRQTMLDFGQVATGFATVFSPVELVRSIRAARDLFKKLMQQSCHTDDHILDRAQAWCSSLEVPYFRLNPPLATIFSIDDKRDEQLINALWQTKLYMRSMRDQLEQLGRLLDERGPGDQ